MENQLQSESVFNLPIDAEAKEVINSLSTWAKIVAVASFVSAAVRLVAAFIGPQMNELEGIAAPSRMGSIMGAIIGATIAVALNLFLFRFSVSAKQGIERLNALELEAGFNNLRIYFKIIGIIVLICLIVLGLIILFGIIGALVGGLSR